MPPDGRRLDEVLALLELSPGAPANAVERYVAAPPNDPDAPAMKARIDAWRALYLRWGRDTLGFGTYLFAT